MPHCVVFYYTQRLVTMRWTEDRRCQPRHIWSLKQVGVNEVMNVVLSTNVDRCTLINKSLFCMHFCVA